MKQEFSFERDGFVIIRDCLPAELRSSFESSVDAIARDMASKQGVDSYRLDTVDLLAVLEASNKPRFKAFLGFVGASTVGFQIASAKAILDALKTSGAADPNLLAPTLPSLFFNSPAARQLQYEWHQELNYYPNEPDGVITVWTPLFNDVGAEQGPMLICRGSHKTLLPYSIEFRDAGLMQLAVSEEEADNYEHIACTTSLGDVVIFHAGALHRTSPNCSRLPRISLICRYFPMKDDFRLPIANCSTSTRQDFIAKAVNSRQFRST